MNNEDLSRPLEHLMQNEYLYIAGGTLALAFLLILLIRRQPKQIVAYKTENGRVFVARSAIKELVQSACLQIDGVTRPHCRIKTKGERINLSVEIKLDSGSQMRAIEALLQKHMRRSLIENLGIEKLGSINIIATGFKASRASSATAKLIETEQELEATQEPETEPSESEVFELESDKKEA